MTCYFSPRTKNKWKSQQIHQKCKNSRRETNRQLIHHSISSKIIKSKSHKKQSAKILHIDSSSDTIDAIYQLKPQSNPEHSNKHILIKSDTSNIEEKGNTFSQYINHYPYHKLNIMHDKFYDDNISNATAHFSGHRIQAIRHNTGLSAPYNDNYWFSSPNTNLGSLVTGIHGIYVWQIEGYHTGWRVGSTLFEIGIISNDTLPSNDDLQYLSDINDAVYYGMNEDGQRFSHNTSYDEYGDIVGHGDVIIMVLNMDKLTLHFYINGVSQGIAFKDIEKRQYRLAVSFRKCWEQIMLITEPSLPLEIKVVSRDISKKAKTKISKIKRDVEEYLNVKNLENDLNDEDEDALSPIYYRKVSDMEYPLSEFVIDGNKSYIKRKCKGYSERVLSKKYLHKMATQCIGTKYKSLVNVVSLIKEAHLNRLIRKCVDNQFEIIYTKNIPTLSVHGRFNDLDIDNDPLIKICGIHLLIEAYSKCYMKNKCLPQDIINLLLIFHGFESILPFVNKLQNYLYHKHKLSLCNKLAKMHKDKIFKKKSTDKSVYVCALLKNDHNDGCDTWPRSEKLQNILPLYYISFMGYI